MLPKYETSNDILKKALADLEEVIPKLTAEQKAEVEKAT